MANTSSPGARDANGATPAQGKENTVRDTARQDWDHAKSQAREDFDHVKREAKHEFDHAREAAGEFAEGQKNYAADQIGGIASAFDRVGTELKDGEPSWVGRYAGDLAGRLESFANHTRSSSVDDLVGDLERFGRERPTAFLAGAALLGFAATRFLSASAGRRTRTQGSRYYGESSSRPTPRANYATPAATAQTTTEAGNSDISSTREQGDRP